MANNKCVWLSAVCALHSNVHYTYYHAILTILWKQELQEGQLERLQVCVGFYLPAEDSMSNSQSRTLMREFPQYVTRLFQAAFWWSLTIVR